ncbi:hypothetical protein [Capybara microvirus Cap1_SP_135]|nr:hypothetical protein [Capybara microvirus Cap1_SP_135]
MSEANRPLPAAGETQAFFAVRVGLPVVHRKKRQTPKYLFALCDGMRTFCELFRLELNQSNCDISQKTTVLTAVTNK